MISSPPILFIAYNRPETTRLVFSRIAEAKPKKIFISLDGPKLNDSQDRNNCLAVREIVNNITWPCDVQKRFLSENLGCKAAVSSAIDWFFKQNEQGIIIEDDVLPDPAFFQFCGELLDYYKNDLRVMQISGYKSPMIQASTEDSFFFSRFGSIWGWATWRRAWSHYDVRLQSWPEVFRRKIHHSFCDSDAEIKWQENIYEKVFNGRIDTWDYQWRYAVMMNSGLSIVPNVNLVTNIGFAQNATHTRNVADPRARSVCGVLNFPLKYPRHVIRNKIADIQYLSGVTESSSTKWRRVKRFFFGFMRGIA